MGPAATNNKNLENNFAQAKDPFGWKTFEHCLSLGSAQIINIL